MQSKGELHRGRFRSERFSPDTPLKRGTYEASVMMPIPDTQPPAVRAIIGDHGEHLAGKLVQKTDMGIVVEAKVLFTVPE